jgi:hypothetical protein
MLVHWGIFFSFGWQKLKAVGWTQVRFQGNQSGAHARIASQARLGEGRETRQGVHVKHSILVVVILSWLYWRLPP